MPDAAPKADAELKVDAGLKTQASFALASWSLFRREIVRFLRQRGRLIGAFLTPVMFWLFIGSGYVFKVIVALLDTAPFYLGVRYLSRYLEIDPRQDAFD